MPLKERLNAVPADRKTICGTRTIQGSRQIVWDDRRRDETRLIAAPHAAGPRTTSFPVVIGAGSHPFPFRTRKLSLPPPMVLHAQVCGRVGHCREYFSKPARRKTKRAFFVCARHGAQRHCWLWLTHIDGDTLFLPAEGGVVS